MKKIRAIFDLNNKRVRLLARLTVCAYLFSVLYLFVIPSLLDVDHRWDRSIRAYPISGCHQYPDELETYIKCDDSVPEWVDFTLNIPSYIVMFSYAAPLWFFYDLTQLHDVVRYGYLDRTLVFFLATLAVLYLGIISAMYIHRILVRWLRRIQLR